MLLWIFPREVFIRWIDDRLCGKCDSVRVRCLHCPANMFSAVKMEGNEIHVSMAHFSTKVDVEKVCEEGNNYRIAKH